MPQNNPANSNANGTGPMSCNQHRDRRMNAGLTKRWRNSNRRRGYTLVLFFMLMFGMLGLAALVIDMGFARLAQSEMQTAVDTAALEGLSQLSSSGGTGSSDGYRRLQAATIASQVFSDPSGSASYGAGPVLDFTGHVSDPTLAAGETILQPGNSPVYQPSLQTNDANATNGDMVAGTYNSNQSSIEADDYTRADFTPSAGTAAASAPAFLARMRRTPLWNVSDSVDNTQGVSTSGPPLPFLWGRGSLLARSGTSNNDLSVSSGVTVRATAIAGPQPAKSVGPAYVNTGGTLAVSPQLAPFGLRSDIWANLVASGGTASATIDPLAAGSGAVVLDSQFRQKLTAIGQPLATSTDETALSAGTQSTAAYVPIYADYGSQQETIVGYVYYTNWSFQSGNLTLGPADTTLRIGSQNVSAAMVMPLPTALTPADATALFQANTALSSQHPLYAPALVDHHIGPTP